MGFSDAEKLIWAFVFMQKFERLVSDARYAAARAEQRQDKQPDPDDILVFEAGARKQAEAYATNMIKSMRAASNAMKQPAGK